VTYSFGQVIPYDLTRDQMRNAVLGAWGSLTFARGIPDGRGGSVMRSNVGDIRAGRWVGRRHVPWSNVWDERTASAVADAVAAIVECCAGEGTIDARIGAVSSKPSPLTYTDAVSLGERGVVVGHWRCLPASSPVPAGPVMKLRSRGAGAVERDRLARATFREVMGLHGFVVPFERVTK